MIKAKRSPLYALSRKVKTVPPTGVVSRLKFRKKSELKLFLRWIESSSEALKGIKSPSKKEIKDLDKESKSGGLGLLALLGIGALGIGAAAGLMGGGSEGEGNEKNPLAKGISTSTDFSGRIPSKINIPKRVVNQKIKTPNTRIKVPKEKIKIPKIKGKSKIKPNLLKKTNVVKKPIPKVKTSVFKPQKIVLNKGLKGFGRNVVNKAGGALVVADATMTTVDRLQEGQTAKQAFVGGAAEATGSFLGFGKGFKIGAAITAKAAAPLLVAPFPGARVLYGAAILTGGIASGFIGSKIGRSVSGGLADRFTGVQKKLENVKEKKINKKKKIIVVPVNNSNNNGVKTIGGQGDIVNNNSNLFVNSNGSDGTTFIINSNNQERLFLTKLSQI